MLPVSALAGPVVSPEPSAVSVTLYRDPDRTEGAINAGNPGGYALITETRTITIPAGESVIRFEGVSEGMFPETAIVTGLPSGVREKNRDARLISPAGLVDAYLSRSVHLRRTNRATGKVVEQDAILRAGPDGGVILQTSEGIEALGCAGLPERMLYDGIPEGLSAKPTLSVLTTSERAVTATVQLSYLAQGFDWSANYVANVAADGKTLNLFAWATIANGGAQSFIRANTQAVAGQPNKEENADPPTDAPPELRLTCWPQDITSTHDIWGNIRTSADFENMPVPVMAMSSEIIVTAQKRMESLQDVAVAITAVQEELGDLKLYRIPEPVTIAAQSQKQVAMIQKSGVKYERIYTASVEDAQPTSQPMAFLLRMKNIKSDGLGVPLPAGGVVLFEEAHGQTLFAGEDSVSDHAIGDDIEFKVGQSADVRYEIVNLARTKATASFRVTITNARATPIISEVQIPGELAKQPRGLIRKSGGWMWRQSVPANSQSVFNFETKQAR